ncbi:MAG: hypothetical protein GY711_01535 [bacterium]|nr:hypothetical protein [bacterium]
MLRFQRFVPLLVAASFAAPAAAQVELVAFESFDYPFPGLVHDMSGGTGWSTNWWAAPDVTHDAVVVQANAPTNPGNPFPYMGADDLGNYAQQAVEFEGAFRFPDAAAHPDVADPTTGLFGVDNTTMWFSFSTQAFQVPSPDNFGGFSLNEQFVAEKLFMGSPWQANSWGVDPQTGNPPDLIPGTSSSNADRLVVRIDYLPGDERLRMWVSPPVAHPLCAADLDIMIPDLVWNEIRIASGGNGTLFYWDNIVIEKGIPLEVGTSVCGPAVANSTGSPADIVATGSDVAADNSLTLTATNLPANEFGYFLASDGATPPGVTPPGSSGLFCLALGPNLGRYAPLVQSSGADGCFSIDVDVSAVPIGGPPFSVALMAGDTWYFQGWFRDGASSNFTDVREVQFL